MVMMRSKRSLLIAATLLVVLALAFAGCGGGGGGSSSGGGNGGSGGGGIEDFNVFVGEWKSENLTPAVTLTVGEPFVNTYKRETDKNYIIDTIFFPGRVTCSNFNNGYLDVSGTNFLDDDENDIWAGIIRDKTGRVIGKNFYVRTREEFIEGGHEYSNELQLDGSLLTDNDNLHVVYLYITEKSQDKIDFDPDDDDESILFIKE